MKYLLLISPLLLLLSCSNPIEKTDESLEEKKRSVVINVNDTITIPLKTKYLHLNDIPPRYQWEHNSGYCGEVSMISAGLYYGQYVSQYDARKIICDTIQNNCQMLLGENDAQLAYSLRLKCDTIVCQNSKEYLNWVKKHVLLGHPVIIGVMNNEYILYGKTNPDAGDPEYDHIVPVMGIGSDSLLDNKEAFENDYILFSDNGLITNDSINPAIPNKKTAQYYFPYRLDDFVGSRERANEKNGHAYTLVDLPNKKMNDSVYNYAIAILGVYGEEETLPVRISTNYNYEAPYIDSQSNIRPKPMPLKLTVSISKLTIGTKYKLFRYDNEENVPTKDFIHSTNYKECYEFKISSGTEYTKEFSINSNEKVFFRCVKAE